MFKNIKDKKYSLGILLFSVAAFFSYLFFSLLYSPHYTPTSPDENQTLFFSKLLAEQKTLIFKNELNQQYKPQIFAPRNYVQKNDKTLPGGFLGYYIIEGIAYSVWPPLIFFISPLMGALCILVMYKTTAIISNEKYAFITASLMAIFPPFFFWSTMLFNNLLELFFILITIYMLIKLSLEEKTHLSYFMLALIFSACAIWVRYVDALFLLLLFFIVQFYHNLFRRSYIFLGCIFILIFFIPFLKGNLQMYESISFGPFSRHLLSYGKFITDAPKQIIPLVPFRSFGIVFTTITLYYFQLLNLFIALIVVGMTIAVKKITTKGPIIILLATALSWFIYYAGGSYSGYSTTQFLLNSSYARYLLITYACLFPFFSIALKDVLFFRKVSPFILVIYFTLSINILFNSSQSLLSFAHQQESYAQVKDEFLNKTEDGSIIFTKYYDKFLFPDRNVALYILIHEHQQVTTTADLINNLLNNGKSLYIVDEDWYPYGKKLASYKSELAKKQIGLTNVDSHLGLYKITKL